MTRIPFNDFARHLAPLRPAVDEAIRRTLDSGWYILGREGAAFERELAEWLGARHAVGVASGTDAITLALLALGIGPGAEVITTAMTAYPTITGIKRAGATPVVVDIEPDTGLLDVRKVAAAVSPLTRAIVPVHLYGQSCDMGALLALGEQLGLPIVEDCAQSIGAAWQGRCTGTLGRLGCFSFYPTKNLGAFGDGGAVVTQDDVLVTRLRHLRNYGQTRRYYHDVEGLNSRLDELQAAILRAKLPALAAANQRRRALAGRYQAQLRGVQPMAERSYGCPAYHLFPVRVARREAFMAALAERGVETLIHYPVPVHRQRDFAAPAALSLPAAEAFAAEIVSLPLYPELSEQQIDEVCQAVNDVTGRG